MGEGVWISARWLDGVIAVVPPSRLSITATSYACLILWELGVDLVAVVLNGYSRAQPNDEYGNKWADVCYEYFGIDPLVLPSTWALATGGAKDFARALWDAVMEIGWESPPTETLKEIISEIEMLIARA